MSNRTVYYIVELEYRTVRNYFLWYYTDTDSTFFTQNETIISFVSVNDLVSFCAEKEILLSNEPITSYNLDVILPWLTDSKEILDSDILLNIWNILEDFIHAQKKTFFGDNNTNLKLYEKLVSANNLPALKRSEKKYIHAWSKEEIQNLKKIFLEGISILDEYFD